MSIRWLRIKISLGYRPPKKDLTCNYHFRKQGIGKQAWKNKKWLCGQRKMTEAWKWIQDRKPEPEKEAECKSTQASWATSFMLTCASPNMPCGDYFPAASDVTLPLLSLLLMLPCFFPHPSLQSKYIFAYARWISDSLYGCLTSFTAKTSEAPYWWQGSVTFPDYCN